MGREEKDNMNNKQCITVGAIIISTIIIFVLCLTPSSKEPLKPLSKEPLKPLSKEPLKLPSEDYKLTKEYKFAVWELTVNYDISTEMAEKLIDDSMYLLRRYKQRERKAQLKLNSSRNQ